MNKPVIEVRMMDLPEGIRKAIADAIQESRDVLPGHKNLLQRLCEGFNSLTFHCKKLFYWRAKHG
jgi:hypothetical protein